MGLESISQLFYIQFFMLNLKNVFAEAKNKKQVKKFCTFLKSCVFWKKRHSSSISYFSIERKNLLRLKSGYSRSAGQTVPNDVKKTRKTIIFTCFLLRPQWCSGCNTALQSWKIFVFYQRKRKFIMHSVRKKFLHRSQKFLHPPKKILHPPKVRCLGPPLFAGTLY